MKKECGKVQEEEMDYNDENKAINNDNKRHMHRGGAWKIQKKLEPYIGERGGAIYK